MQRDRPTPHAAKPPAARGGFTLVEVLIASAILAGAALAIATPFSYAAQHQRLDVLRANAANLAAQQMERLAAMTHAARLDRYRGGGEFEFRSVHDAPIAGADLDPYTLTIAVDEIAIPLPGESDEDAARFCRALVTVRHPDVEPVSLARLFPQE